MQNKLSVCFFAVFYLILFGASIVFARRRLHDIGLGGWFVLLSLIPIANVVLGIMLLFKRGDEGHNKFGPPSQRGSWGWLLLAVSIPLIGIVAAIALPAYQDYSRKAKAHNAELIEKQQQRDAQHNAGDADSSSGRELVLPAASSQK